MADTELQALEPRQRIFVAEFLKDFNATDAMRRSGYSDTSGPSKLLAHSKIKAAIAAGLREKIDSAGRDAQALLDHLWFIVTSDPNGLTEMSRRACRYCHGTDFKECFTPAELGQRRRQYDASLTLDEIAGLKEPPPFDEGGGVFKPLADPNPDCPECAGIGVERVIVKETRNLPPQLRALYRGVIRKSDGTVEIKMASHEKALELLAKYYGLLDDRIDFRVNGEIAARILAARTRV